MGGRLYPGGRRERGGQLSGVHLQRWTRWGQEMAGQWAVWQRATLGISGTGLGLGGRRARGREAWRSLQSIRREGPGAAGPSARPPPSSPAQPAWVCGRGRPEGAGEASLALRRPETLRSPSPGTDWTLRLPLSQRCTQCLQERQGSRSDSARGLPPPWRCLCALLTKDGACWKERSGAMDTGSRSLPETKGTARRGQGGASGGCL